MAAPDRPRCGPEADPCKFSVVFNPTVVVKRDSCRAFIRHLPVLQEDEVPAKASMNPRLSNVVVVVKAQTRVLHFFRGRRLSRIIEFSSSIVDVAGFPRGASHMIRNPSRSSLLCVVMCRDGTAYAIPTHEILGAAQGAREMKPANDGLKRDSSSISPGAALKKKSRPSFSAEPLGLFDDMAPTLMEGDRSCPSPPSQKQEDKPGKANGGGNSGSRSNRVVSLGAQVGLVIRAQEQWAIFGHLGARVIAVCDVGDAVAVAGIIDRASLYGLPGGSRESRDHTGRCLGALCAVDGTSPTSSCVVWMGNGGSGEDSPSVGCSAWCDEKGFSLNPRVFRALFGPELALLGTDTLASQPSRPTHLPSKPAVVLVGDEAGVVRWSPVPPHPLVPGGVLATLRKSIVGMLPRLEGDCHESVGFLIVAADGTILSVAAVGPAREVTRKLEKNIHESGSHVDGRETGLHQQGKSPNDVEPSDTFDLPSISTRRLKVPFPIAFPCSVPGFLVHCHAGAIFATALPALDDTDGTGGVIGSGREAGGILRFRRVATNKLSSVTQRPAAATLAVFDSLGIPLPLRPVRIPLPCEITAVAVAPVLSEVGAEKAVNCDAIASQMMIVCLSVRGKLLGFMAPRSADELDGWGLDSGKGGVRVGGSAGVERRVRCQLERLSSVGRQCAMLSTESAKKDSEIRTLRGATGLLPTLVADATRRSAREKMPKGPQNVGSSPLGYSLSMVADRAENASFDSVHGMMGQAEALRVRLYIRLCVNEENCTRELPNAGEDGPGRWSIVTRVLPETRGHGYGKAVNEGWSWSTSTPMPMALLRLGSPWASSVALCLPSAEPVTVSSWLQYRFRDKSGDSENGAICHVMDQGGCYVELGSSRFDILDWGVALRSIPSSTAAVREAARGRGSYFCGTELMTEILREPLSVTSGSGAGRFEPSPASRVALPSDWDSFRLCLVNQDYDANILLSLLLPSSISPDIASASNGGESAGSRVVSTEYALRVGGQVVVVRARGFSVARGAMGNEKDRGKETISKDVEIVVTCSHEAMAPVVREALLFRARTLPLLLDVQEDCGLGRVSGAIRTDKSDKGALMARADAVARFVREIHPVRQAVANTSDAARTLAVERAKNGPSSESASKALVLMSKVAGVYQELRRQQERVGAAL
ncbi:unnamed protein product [Ascophyllum nodosum]